MSRPPEFHATLMVAPGAGRLVRRVGACVFVPAPCDDQVAALIGHVLDIDDDLAAAIGDYIVAHDDTPPFVLVTWPTGRVDEGIQLVLRGEATATTDIASVPSLSGLDSTTWVEYTVRTLEHASIHSADPGALGTSLTSGVVPAGGFSLHLAAPDRTADVRSSDAISQIEPAIEPDTSTPTAATPTAAEPEADPAPPVSVGLAALRAATERIEPDAVADPEASASAKRAGAPGFPADGAGPAHQRTPIDDMAGRPPGFPGTRDDGDDPEVILGPGDLDPAPAPPVQRLVQATMCAAGHSNPPHHARCRVCDLQLCDDTTVTVDQPILAVAELPGGQHVPVDGNIVLGRNPSATTARLDDDHRLVAFDAAESVSRTHAVLSAAGWSITFTDCGSQGGSALVPAGSDEPIELTAWVPHDLNGGDVVYLGGPTHVRILDAPG